MAHKQYGGYTNRRSCRVRTRRANIRVLLLERTNKLPNMSTCCTLSKIVVFDRFVVEYR